MNTIHLTDAELSMARHGMTSYLRSFGHDEAETVALIKQVLDKLGHAERDDERDEEDPVFIG